jgi:hypothetical protein
MFLIRKMFLLGKPSQPSQPNRILADQAGNNPSKAPFNLSTLGLGWVGLISNNVYNRPFQPNQMLVGKAGSLSKSGTLERYFARAGSGLTIP